MSSFIGRTPSLNLRLWNHLVGVAYPSDGSVSAVLDTGYEGFLSVPSSNFESLALDKGRTLSSSVELPNGKRLETKVAYASVELVGMEGEVDGPVETFQALEEVIVGLEFLNHFRVTLDYCLSNVSIARCT